ncbi:IS3 family transposase, partial [Staphylococcus pasteuri]|uniref:IS3 family transposase n=1 Tax=Staphylococcus pasteuri TaxID=45972 RepID=UPI0036F41670
MSTKPNSLHNPSIQNFFPLLKQQIYYPQSFQTFQQLQQSIHKYITFYNNTTIKPKLKPFSPNQYRKQ